MSPLVTGVQAALIACLVVLALCLVGMLVKAWARVPRFPPLYDYRDEDDVLPEPTLRSRRYQPSPESEWIIDGPNG